jgi:hypothetical protein
MPISGHDRHVMPVRMAGEGKEIKVFPGYFDRSPEGTFRIANRIMIMDITPIKLVPAS